MTAEIEDMREDAGTSPTGPRVLIVRVLEACDAGCFMCEFARSQASYRLPVSQARDMGASARSGSLRLVRFTGGEPLLHEQLPALIRAFAEEGLITSVITNGGLITARLDELVDAGIGQFVVSIDSPHAVFHDRFRKTPGLFERAVAGICELRERAPDVHVRVNTVAGPHNVHQLEEMFDMLGELGVQAWSIIPLKAPESPWPYPQRARAREHYERFRANVAGRPGPRLIGHSLHWMGRDEAEIDAYLSGVQQMTPRGGSCRVADLVRYFTPRSGDVYPCNCVPHRTAGRALSVPWSIGHDGHVDGGAPARWLRANGPATCTGCEPANAALGEGAIDLDLDPLGF